MGYKRRPIINEAERAAIVKSLEIVDDIVCPCPLLVTKEFMQKWKIDLVVHGFADENDRDRQIDEFFRVAVEEGKFQEINYYSKMSTTDIISRIAALKDDTQKQKPALIGHHQSQLVWVFSSCSHRLFISHPF
jgi:choline-phosphate cytidylyltransferase